MKTRAAVCRAFGAPLTVETVELAEPGPGEVLITTAACAICHSDIFYMDGAWGGELPAVYGHEASGVVEAVGAGVNAAQGRRPCGGDAHPQLRLLPGLRGRRAGLLRGGVPARPPDAACRRRRQAARARAAHRRLRRTHRRRPVAGGRNPEGHAARQRGPHRLRRADRLRRGRQHRKGQGRVERRRHRLRRRRPQLHPGRAAFRLLADHRRRRRAGQARRRPRIRRDPHDQRQGRGRRGPASPSSPAGARRMRSSSPSASRARRNRAFR